MSRINFRKLLEVESLLKNSENDLYVNNIVSTAQLLKDKETICLESLVMFSGGMAKYAPKKFAAAILRIKDSISTTTCLVFRSGKLVVVGAQSEHHSIFSTQKYRQIIENIYSVYRIERSLICSTLVGRTELTSCRITNIVAHAKLKNRPDLKILSELAADLTAWNPDLFPGLKLLVWLKPKNDCKCVKKKKNKSCECNCRALIFDTGQVVITGCKNLEDVKHSKNLIEQLLDDPDLHNKDEEPAKKDRSLKRREKIIKCAQIEFIGWKEEVSVFELVQPVKKNGKKIAPLPSNNNMPIINACKNKQVENIKFIASFDSKQARMAVEYLQNNPNELTEDMMKLLENLVV
jgi:TATA-box binding protein (TBP) (component of TFIID and TFIIIB)